MIGQSAADKVMGGWLLRKAKEQGGKKFSIKFLSRSMKVSDQNMPNWKEIERMAAELGITVEHAKCDCSSQPSVEEFIKADSPNIVGMIHSAGILQDSMLFNQTWEKFDAVWDSKSRAAFYIHDAFERYENPGLQFFWVFSSGAVYGNMGQLNYSASNAWLDALARHRRALGKPCMAPQWGAWGEVGMAANLDDASRRRERVMLTSTSSNRHDIDIYGGSHGSFRGKYHHQPWFDGYAARHVLHVQCKQRCR